MYTVCEIFSIKDMQQDNKKLLFFCPEQTITGIGCDRHFYMDFITTLQFYLIVRNSMHAFFFGFTVYEY